MAAKQKATGKKAASSAKGVTKSVQTSALVQTLTVCFTLLSIVFLIMAVRQY